MNKIKEQTKIYNIQKKINKINFKKIIKKNITLLILNKKEIIVDIILEINLNNKMIIVKIKIN